MTAGEVPRPLSPVERGVLDGALRLDFPGVAALRRQAVPAQGTRGCDCGCGTIALHVPEQVPEAHVTDRTPADGTVVDADGAAVGGLLLFVDDGRLSALEVYSLDDEVLAMPAPDRVIWHDPEEPSAPT